MFILVTRNCINYMIDILTNVIGTIIGGLILTFVLFYLNEYVFLKQNLTGEWETIISIEKTSFRKFINLPAGW